MLRKLFLSPASKNLFYRSHLSNSRVKLVRNATSFAHAHNSARGGRFLEMLVLFETPAGYAVFKVFLLIVLFSTFMQLWVVVFFVQTLRCMTRKLKRMKGENRTWGMRSSSILYILIQINFHSLTSLELFIFAPEVEHKKLRNKNSVLIAAQACYV